MTDKKKTRPSYSPEFKREAVARGQKEGITKAAGDLGISAMTLKNWTLKAQQGPSEAGKPSYRDLERENRKLRKELGYVTEINRILKKSTAILLSDEMGGLK